MLKLKVQTLYVRVHYKTIDASQRRKRVTYTAPFIIESKCDLGNVIHHFRILC